MALTSCEQDTLESSPTEASTDALPPITWNALSEAEQKELYATAANDFEYTYWYTISEGQVLGNDFVSGLPAPQEISRKDLMTQLDYFVERGDLAPQDVASLLELLEFFGNRQWNRETPLSDVSNQLNGFLTDNAINSTDYPLTFHMVKFTEELLVNNLITRNTTDEGALAGQKNDDGQLCTTSGFLCPSQSAIASAASNAASAAFASALVSTAIKATGPLGAGILAIMRFAFRDLFTSIFCNVDCDECGPAAGVIAIYNSNCSLRELRAAGSFEFAERFIFLVDGNLDGAFEADPVVPQNSLPGSAITSPQNRVIVDVVCDGNRSFLWPRNRAIFISSDQRQMNPSAWVTASPAPSGFVLPMNTQICFTLTELSDATWNRVGWSAPTGNPSSGGTFNNTFCTSFSGATRLVNVGMRYQNPCNTSQERIIGVSFVARNQ
ncbi:MAG: hypothetical protein HC821_04100 [Lewinella sp.]|nr:hypothetical protein [Lewinella sp.]